MAILALSLTCFAGPIDFAVADYNAAVASRDLKWKVKYDVSLDPPETFHVEPYAYGGAHVSGGDLRGLMYGLLEAADQIRATGHIKATRGAPATAIRAIRRFAHDDVADWRLYFETLARDRFNRFTLIYTSPPGPDRTADLDKLRAASQAAADYAVDFTLAFWYEPDESIARVIAACPMIRTVQIRTMAHDPDRYRVFVFKPLHDAGRRIALDPDPDLAAAAQREGVALRVDVQSESWPPNFEIEAPADFGTHSEFYWMWGRLGYDPKSKPAHGENAGEFRWASQIIATLAEARAPANDWIASAAETAANRTSHRPSAKLTPLELAESLGSLAASINASNVSAASIDASSVPDFRLLAQMASAESIKLRDGYAAMLPKGSASDPGLTPAAALLISGTASGFPVPARPQFTHVAVHAATADQPINLTLQIAPLKDVRLVRLHYRALGTGVTSVVEKPAAASVAFTIPPASADLLYYFEILDRANGGWFEPDPAVDTPFHVVRIQPKQ